MTVRGYTPGYYLSTRHVRNVVEELKVNLYGNRVKGEESRSSSRSASTERGHDPESHEVEEKSGADTEEEFAALKKARGSPEYLKRILDLYKPLHPSMPVTISSFKKNLKSSAEKEDKSSPRRFPGTYAPPAQGMPQTFHDFNLNVRLQSLIEGELQLGGCSRSPTKHVHFGDSASPAAAHDVTEKREADEKYNEYLTDYVYPYLLDGYKYPYTRWLMLKREISRMEREEKRRAASCSNLSRSMSSLNDSRHFKSDRPKTSCQSAGSTGVLKKYGSMSSLELPPRKHGYLGPAQGNSAYKYRARPWEYMQILRQEDYRRSMENLML